MEKQKYDFSRLNTFLSESGGINDIEELLLEGAKDYYANVRYETNDYVSKMDIEDSLDDAFDEFAQQANVLCYIENFAKIEQIDINTIFSAIKEDKENIIAYLLFQVGEIASEANKGIDD